jgi:ribosomal protein S18 acetylase RimI-like enzyme
MPDGAVVRPRSARAWSPAGASLGERNRASVGKRVRAAADAPKMRAMLRKATIASLDAGALAAAFLRVYEDYVVPVQITPESLARHVALNDVDREDSPLWLDEEGRVAALGLMGLRGARGWIGGFGVAVAHRGQGLARALARDMLERGARRGLRQVQLEVITRNTPAIRTYLNAGFATRRNLLVYVRPADASAPRADTGSVREAGADIVLGAAIEARGPDAMPGMCWQREPASMLGRGGLEALALGAPGQGSFLLYAAAPGGVRIAALYAASDDEVAALLAALAARRPGLPFSLLNEPEDSRYRPALEALGFVERLRQHEMVAPIEV